MMASHPPPPPPPPQNPWAGRALIVNEPLIPNSIWPDRLLHVATMTSYVKAGRNIYNGVQAPDYNVLSYTWGYYQDRTSTKAIAIHGVNWPIPAIQERHFSTASFQSAISRAAKGLRHHCEWIWLDIACIHQQHDGETTESAALRGQEIGRQVQIFQRARESFAWLSSLRQTDLPRPLTNVDDIILLINNHMRPFSSAQAASHFLRELDRLSKSLEEWMGLAISHPWFQSLWTLQEMILRSDTTFLFDDGFLLLYNSKGGKVRPWNISQAKADFFALQSVYTDPRLTDCVKKAEVMVVEASVSVSLQTRVCYLAMINQRLQRMINLQEDMGLAPSIIEFPHTAYSLAQHRRASQLKDRIYGIVQTYGISCSAFPPGKDQLSQLHALEDEFGTKLVARSPILSQVFIHSSGDHRPRRTWLITQKCKVNDWFWTNFTTERQVESLFDFMTVAETTEENGFHDICLKLASKSWYLTSFVSASASPTQRVPLFSPARPGFPQNYRGMMLDYHVSQAVLGRVVDYFDDHEDMFQAVQALEKYFGQKRTRIALLGSGHLRNLPVVSYVGIVLAPVGPVTAASPHVPNDCKYSQTLTDPNHPEADVEPVVWERIGLMRWTEGYLTNDEAPHQVFPPYHNFEYLVI